MRQPARVDYWDDEIDSISSFDLLTQRRASALEKIYLSPAREVLFGDTAEDVYKRQVVQVVHLPAPGKLLLHGFGKDHVVVFQHKGLPGLPLDGRLLDGRCV